jgi:tetratricopeptide (TPR) repeat protein
MKNLLQAALLSLLLTLAADPAGAQQDRQKQDSQKNAENQPQESSSKKNLPDPDAEAETKPGEKPGEKSDDKNGKAADKYDPYPAQKDLEVGMFYLHKGNVDAAIDRFKDAIELRPNFAKPRLLIAEAYEKKGEKEEALKYYKEYLQVFPTAPDAKNIRKKIEKLSGQ